MTIPGPGEYRRRRLLRRLLALAKLNVAEQVKVEVATLDEFASAQGLGSFDFPKIDMEGHSLEMLRGGKQALARFRPTIWCEVFKSEPGWKDPAATVGWLIDRRYYAFVLKEGRPHLRQSHDDAF